MSSAPLLGLVLVVASVAPRCGAAAPIPESYLKAWDDPAIRAKLDQNIEKNRKGDFAIEVVGADGKPLAGTAVTVRQTGHEFLFGCNAFVLGQLKTPEANAAYEQAFTRLFNFATVPFYWEATEPTRGELRYQEEGSREFWRRPPPDRYLAWAAKNHLTLKGHPLVWHAYNPAWLPKDAEELRGLYVKRIGEISGRYGDKIKIWDVVNESLEAGAKYPLFTPDRAYVPWAFDQATKVFPADCHLMINEVTHHSWQPIASNGFYKQVKDLLGRGTPIKGIGFQFHFFSREALDKHLPGAAAAPQRLLDVYEKFAEFDKPMWVTEITIPSAGEGGEAVQARVVEDLYRLWFGAPKMAGITWWNLGDNTAVPGENKAMGGLADGDLKPKASYKVLDRLINQEWRTRAEVKTDAAGVASFRGFYGTYEVESGGKKATVKLTTGAGRQRVMLGEK